MVKKKKSDGTEFGRTPPFAKMTPPKARFAAVRPMSSVDFFREWPTKMRHWHPSGCVPKLFGPDQFALAL